MIGGQSNKGTKYWFTTQTRFKMLPTICAFVLRVCLKILFGFHQNNKISIRQSLLFLS
jgi:hypothetical protein